MASLGKVCCIMDVDGFDKLESDNNGLSYRPKFLIRELAYIRIDPAQEFLPISFRFNLGTEINLNTISDKERRTIEYQSKKVIGLPVLPSRNEVVQDYASLKGVVQGMYRMCRHQNLDLVAYKGGQKEKELLDSLGIPSLNLQIYGCPTYKALVEKKRVYTLIKDCGQHKAVGGLIHCPMAEVTAYRDWYMLNYQKSESSEVSHSFSDSD